LAGKLHRSTLNPVVVCVIYASLGASISGAVAVALINHQWHSKPAYIYQSLGIKQPCSIHILQVLARLLDKIYIFEFRSRMAYVVRLIPVASILLSISILGLHFYPLKVC
jgi:hypothetical protein